MNHFYKIDYASNNYMTNERSSKKLIYLLGMSKKDYASITGANLYLIISFVKSIDRKD